MPLFLPVEARWTSALETRPWAAIWKCACRRRTKQAIGREVKTVTSAQSPTTWPDMRPPPEPAGPSNVMHVKSKTFQLEYQLDDKTVGPSKVASVDIWKLRQGRGWQKCKEKRQPGRTGHVTVDASGRWGFA